ncbi:hypothetical protein RGQ29_001530 [Quercus rubra]|uniref:Uncharacterized protein n=1 Tax=Quercus rubra TaxID=3512 RepID=A0AAN7G9F4_QUERU|nr:hypothetical protein RGQ29_001530 [Quercus rubra]
MEEITNMLESDSNEKKKHTLNLTQTAKPNRKWSSPPIPSMCQNWDFYLPSSTSLFTPHLLHLSWFPKTQDTIHCQAGWCCCC